jgi:hypothetical protein
MSALWCAPLCRSSSQISCDGRLRKRTAPLAIWSRGCWQGRLKKNNAANATVGRQRKRQDPTAPVFPRQYVRPRCPYPCLRSAWLVSESGLSEQATSCQFCSGRPSVVEFLAGCTSRDPAGSSMLANGLSRSAARPWSAGRWPDTAAILRVLLKPSEKLRRWEE